MARAFISSLIVLVASVASTCCAFAQQVPPVKRGVAAIEAVEGAFRISLTDGSVREREAASGMVLVYETEGKILRIRVGGIRPDPTDTMGHRLLHDFRDASTGQSICDTAPDGTREGFPIAGRAALDGTIHPAEPGAFVISCTSGGQGKCVRFGYSPWLGQDLADLYNSCIHMLRADYCGNGDGTTRNGTPIDIYDDRGIQKAEVLPGQSFEAGWGPNGAVCVAHVRIKENISLDGLMQNCPRLAVVAGQKCDEGSARQAGAHLFNRSVP